ncbi:hypothetical protein ACNOYE_10620 [Nannocystaceae bacterium ST9]
MRTALVSVIIGSTIFIGCAGKSSQSVTHPAKVHELGEGKGAFVTTYDSRGRGAYIVVNADGGLKNDATGKSILLCAEPPPDASGNVDYSDALKTSVEASVAYEVLKAAVDVGVDRDVSASSHIIDVVARSELVLLMRDALYRLCEFHLNGTLTAEQVGANYSELLRMAKQLGQRDNVAKLTHALEVSIAEGADPQIVAGILVTIQALSFVEAADQSQEKTLKTVLTFAAARTVLSADEMAGLVRELEGEILSALEKAKTKAAAAKMAAEKKPQDKALQEALTAAQAEVAAEEARLSQFRKDNNLPAP